MYGSADEAIEVLRDAIEGGGDTLEVTLRLPARTAEKILTLLEAEGVSGAVVVPVKDLNRVAGVRTRFGSRVVDVVPEIGRASCRERV